MKKFLIILLFFIVTITSGCNSDYELIPNEGYNNPPPVVNVYGEQYIVGGNTPSNPPSERQILGKFSELSKWPNTHGETNMDYLIGQPYALVDGELLVYVENWPFQNEKLQYVYSNGWIKCDKI